ncbi:MAG: hypothetical protein KDE33_11410, partial [Bacteroidetes bacterium]|nr:hypothetical protein [Bacteroidota bacterium]
MGIIARQSIKASVVGFVGVGIGAVTTLFITPKFLTPEEIGTLSTIQRSSILLYSFMILGVIFSVRKFSSTDFSISKYNYKEFLGANLVFLSISCLLFSLVYVLLKDVILSFFIQNSEELSSFIYFPLFLAIVIVFSQFFFVVAGVSKRIVFPNFFNSVVNRLLSVAILIGYGYGLMKFYNFTILYMTAFYVLPFILISVYVLYFLKVRIEIPDRLKLKSVFKDTYKYNSFLYLTITSSIIIQSIDTIMISSMKGTADAAIYTIAFFIATIIEIPQRMLVQVASPIISNKLKSNDFKGLQVIYKESSLFQLFIAYVLFSGIWFNLDAIYKIMPNGSIYEAGWVVVLLISIAKITDIGFGLNKQIIEMSEYYNFNLFINIFMSLLVVVLNLVLIPKYGINGAALASLISV